jgi:guanosine-3',5'-bis(diphosphate) 3'-pyrophosphohydrolase
MPPTLDATYRPLLEAVSFAARAHRHQLRKDRETPYAGHVFRVCLVLSHVFGVKDARVLTTAVLHDTVEDTTTDFDDLAEQWDGEIAAWVAVLSKDKRLPYDRREEAYCAGLARSPWQVQVVKLADLFDNVLDAGYLAPGKRLNDLRTKKRRYLDALRSDLKPEAAEAWQLVARLFDETEARLAAEAGG